MILSGDGGVGDANSEKRMSCVMVDEVGCFNTNRPDTINQVVEGKDLKFVEEDGGVFVLC